LFDVVIRGGMLIDGSGTPGYPADVAITGDAIVAIGKPIEGEARRMIDATGKVVAPGFIDLHSHADFSFFVDPDADSKITQGVTFEYVGNCGISFCAPLIGDSGSDLETRKAWYDTEWAPEWTSFEGFLDALAKNGSTLNIATQVGHGTVRRAVMGMIVPIKRRRTICAGTFPCFGLISFCLLGYQFMSKLRVPTFVSVCDSFAVVVGHYDVSNATSCS